MHLVRFLDADGNTAPGLMDGSGEIRRVPRARTVGELLALDLAALRALLEETAPLPPAVTADEVLLLPPVDGLTEVWGAGLTYRPGPAPAEPLRPEQAVSRQIYASARPELFFKAPAWRVVTDGEPVGVRPDAVTTVPEAELGIVLNRYGDTVGHLVSNDLSCTFAEGRNPLYAPQSKIYEGSAALSSGIALAWHTPGAPDDLTITVEVRRGAETPFQDSTTTGEMVRPPAEQIEHLFRSRLFPEGAVLSTGCGLFPAPDFTLVPGDVVAIGIEGVGRLLNRVVESPGGMDWLVDAVRRPAGRRAVRVSPARSGG
jgi:2-dehydro-3-deoxy-D-arabinonate dehydratase